MAYNPMLLTVAPYVAKPETWEEVEALWNDGKDFKIYNGPYTSIRDVLRMRMAGFTHVLFICQRADRSVTHQKFELK